MNIELVGTLLFYAEVSSAKDIKQAVIMLEGVGNVVIGITPIHAFNMDNDLFDLQAVFIQVAGEAKPLSRPGTTNAS